MSPRKQSTPPTAAYVAKPNTRKEYWKEKTVHWDVLAKRRQYLDVLLRVVPELTIDLQQRLDAIPPSHEKKLIVAVQGWRDDYHLDDWIVDQLISVRGYGGKSRLTALTALKIPPTELDLGADLTIPEFSFHSGEFDLGIEGLSEIRRRVRDQFKKEWKEFEKRIRPQVSKRWEAQTFKRAHKAEGPEHHFEWLALFQSKRTPQGKPTTQKSIAKRANVTVEAVHKAVKQTAYQLRIKLRTAHQQRWSD